MSFKDLPNEEKPREKILMHGVESLSNEELLMVILKSGTKRCSVKDLANELLSQSGGVRKFRDMTLQELLKVRGIGTVKAIELVAIIEFSKRIHVIVSELDMMYFTKPEVIVQYFFGVFSSVLQEEFFCVYLDQKKKFLCKKKLFVGTINSSIVHPREIFKEAYLLSASFIICIHNHPSGDPTPSREDIVFTKKLKELGELHAIYLVDHLIVGKSCYYSFYEDGMLG